MQEETDLPYGFYFPPFVFLLDFCIPSHPVVLCMKELHNNSRNLKTKILPLKKIIQCFVLLFFACAAVNLKCSYQHSAECATLKKFGAFGECRCRGLNRLMQTQR